MPPAFVPQPRDYGESRWLWRAREALQPRFCIRQYCHSERSEESLIKSSRISSEKSEMFHFSCGLKQARARSTISTACNRTAGRSRNRSIRRESNVRPLQRSGRARQSCAGCLVRRTGHRIRLRVDHSRPRLRPVYGSSLASAFLTGEPPLTAATALRRPAAKSVSTQPAEAIVFVSRCTFDFGWAVRSRTRTSAPDFIVTAVICQLGLQAMPTRALSVKFLDGFERRSLALGRRRGCGRS